MNDVMTYGLRPIIHHRHSFAAIATVGRRLAMFNELLPFRCRAIRKWGIIFLGIMAAMKWILSGKKSTRHVLRSSWFQHVKKQDHHIDNFDQVDFLASINWFYCCRRDFPAIIKRDKASGKINISIILNVVNRIDLIIFNVFPHKILRLLSTVIYRNP